MTNNSSDKGSSEKGEGLLTSVAETIGSTLGSLVARAGAAQKSLSTAANETVATVKKATSRVKAVRKKVRRGPAQKTSAKRAVKSGQKSKRSKSSKSSKNSKNTVLRKAAKRTASAKKRRSRR